MPLLASNVMDRSRAVLNDIALDLYTNEVLLPYLQIANDDLCDELTDNGATVNKEVTVDMPLNQGNKTPILPSDMIVPIELFEKDTGTSDDYYKFMWQRDFLPNTVPGNQLGIWAWRKQTINTLGSTIDKFIRARYYRVITALSGENAPVELAYSLSYLAYHTAALAAEHIGQNQQKAITLETVAIQKLNKLLKREVKQNQARPVRRLPFRLKKYVNYTR